jgi:alpha 1,3-glucosidase
LIDQFNTYQIPLDVYWLDIDYTKDKKYFEFDEERFQDFESKVVHKMKGYEKRLTIITDPHIKVDEEFFVFNEGKNIEVARDFTGYIERGAFIRDSSG